MGWAEVIGGRGALLYFAAANMRWRVNSLPECKGVLLFILILAPSQSGLPTLGHITHNSIQVSWAPPHPPDGLKYNLQESEKANEFKTVYR